MVYTILYLAFLVQNIFEIQFCCVYEYFLLCNIPFYWYTYYVHQFIDENLTWNTD